MDTKGSLTPVVDENDTIIIELDRPRELNLSHKAMKRFSALTGCSMTEMEEEVSRYDKLTCLLYVMLAVDAEKHDETLTPEQVDDLLEKVPVNQLVKLAIRAIQAAFDDGEEETETEEGQDDPLEAAGTGGEA